MVANDLSEGSVGRICLSLAVTVPEAAVLCIRILSVADRGVSRRSPRCALVLIKARVSCVHPRSFKMFWQARRHIFKSATSALSPSAEPTLHFSYPAYFAVITSELSKQRRRHLDPIPDLTWQSRRQGDRSGSDLSLRQQRHLRKSSFCVLWHDTWESLLTVSTCLRWQSGSTELLSAPGDPFKLSMERNLKRSLFLCPKEENLKIFFHFHKREFKERWNKVQKSFFVERFQEVYRLLHAADNVALTSRLKELCCYHSL